MVPELKDIKLAAFEWYGGKNLFLVLLWLAPMDWTRFGGSFTGVMRRRG